jgi:hypothetical protein
VRSVTFNFHPDVSTDRQDGVLERINTWGDIRQASRLKPGAKHPLLLRMAYAHVRDDADINGLIGRLLKLPEIESASIPPTRRLVKGATEKKSRAV